MNNFSHYPIYSLLKEHNEYNRPAQPVLKDDTLLNDSKKRKKVICRECGFVITETALAITINNSHEHSFFNPHGYVFQIRCFSMAKGCIEVGEPSSEFPWFAGHTWQIAACGNCLTHLGWKFKSGENSFYGLIKNNIHELQK